jgi:ribosomal protein S18 acetylase RimI-like enzyme
VPWSVRSRHGYQRSGQSASTNVLVRICPFINVVTTCDARDMTSHVNVLIRRYEPEDRTALVRLSPRLAIGVAEWRDSTRVLRAVRGWIDASLDSARDDDHAVFVAIVDNRVVGVVTLAERRHFSSDVDGYIGELVIAEDMEGCGVGQALLLAAEDWVRRRGRRHLTLETGAHNDRALSFYRRNGYEDEDVRLTRTLSPA